MDVEQRKTRSGTRYLFQTAVAASGTLSSWAVSKLHTELVLTFLGSRSDVVNEKIVDPPGSQADYDQTILTKSC